MSIENSHILIVEDERDIRELMRICAESGGYRVTTAGSVSEALVVLGRTMPDLVLMDIQLPDGDGMRLCSDIRAKSDIPLILVTCKKEGGDIVAGLESGANDYVVKPFDIDVLMARIRSQLRSYAYWKQSSTTHRLRDAYLDIDLDSCEVRTGGQSVALSAKERQLLLHLARHPNQVFSAGSLYDSIWGMDGTGDEHTVSVHMRYLRRKLEPDPSEPTYLQTIRGFGYKLHWMDDSRPS